MEFTAAESASSIAEEETKQPSTSQVIKSSSSDSPQLSIQQVPQQDNQALRPKSTTLCRYFQQGRCVRGETCNFSHDIASATPIPIATAAMNEHGMPLPQMLPPPVIVNIPMGTASIFSIDVECIATGHFKFTYLFFIQFTSSKHLFLE